MQLAVAAGVLAKLPPPEERPPYQPVEVVGKTPKQVAAVIVDAVGAENAARGCVIVICGLSGESVEHGCAETEVDRMQSSLLLCFTPSLIFLCHRQ